MLDDNLLDGLQSQTLKELYSAYLYYSMANHFEMMGLFGFSHWMRMQTFEELGHADIFRFYIGFRDDRPELRAIPQPDAIWNGYRDPFEDALRHEKKVTQSIRKLLKRARLVNDPASVYLLEIFDREQKEEVKGTREVLKKVLAPRTERALAKVDLDLSKREMPKPVEIDWDLLAELIE